MATGLWIRSTDPPRLSGPTMMAPPRVLRSRSAPTQATSTGRPSPEPDLSASNGRSWIVYSWARGSRCPPTPWPAHRDSAHLLSHFAGTPGGEGWFRIFAPPPGPMATSIRYSPTPAGPLPDPTAQTWPGGSGSASMASSLCRLRSRDKLLDAVHPQREREMRIAELTLKTTLLLLLDAPARLQCQAKNPLQFFIRNRHLRVWKEQLDQSRCRLVHGFDVGAPKALRPRTRDSAAL